MVTTGTFSQDWSGETISPDEILYYLEGPAIFRKKIGPLNFLFFKAEENEEADLYIASQLPSRHFDLLKQGRLSVRGALLCGNLFAFELDLQQTVLRYQEVKEADVEKFLPPVGVALKSAFGVAPDSVQQSEASYSFKFFGSQMAEEGMPFSTFKGLVDDVYATLRRILTPPSLGQGRAATVLNFPIRQPEFASLLIAIDKPFLDSARLARSKRTEEVDADAILAQSDEQGRDFAEHLKHTVQVASENKLTEQFASDNFDFLQALVEILPSQRAGLSKLQFSANPTDGSSVFVEVDLLTAEKIRASMRQIEDREMTHHGFISGVLDKSHTIRIQTRFGREITCELKREIFDELLAEERLSIGRPLIVSGKFTKRQIRDFLKVDGFPTFP